MPQGVNAIPIAKMLTPAGPEPWRYVTPLGYEWWTDMTPLELAHREGRLLCPYCGGRLLYCCGPVKVPYFRHPEKSCLSTGLPVDGTSKPRSRVRASMFRFGLARLLLEVLPAGTQLDQERAFLSADEDLLFTLPSGDRFIVVVECDPDGSATLTERLVRYTASDTPVFWVFTGDLLYRQIREARTLADTRLDPLAVTIMQWGDVRRPSAKSYVDLAYKAATTYPFLKVAAPGSLLFYQPGSKREELGALIGLRGVLPAPTHQNRWVGAAVRGEVTRGQSHRVRFSLRRGFYFEQDLVVLKAYRKQVNDRRAWERQQKFQAAAAAKLRAEQLEAERKRRSATIQVQSQPDSDRESYRAPARWSKPANLTGSPSNTYRKNVVNGMVQGCPLKKQGPIQLDDCTYCDYRCGGDGSTYMGCGWPRRH